MAREQEQQIATSNINRICQGTEIIGNIKTSGDIRFDGVLEGNIISSGKLVIGSVGKTKGEINCRTADIFGFVDGVLDVSEIVNLKASANIKGTITTAKISIEAGAIFNGTCTMPEPQKNQAAQKKG
ncbi:MAG: polymer-forming cytoskeletal protein [Prevotellaceae bacterium]|jgi:cytoskeletal protein CcmA (bactofilin family)|nr:polymer-forming cytoskeletal protein [Prevotellaceae bacterium]